MDKKKLIIQAFDEAREKGIKEIEAYTDETQSFKIAIFNGKLEEYKASQTQATGFRGTYKGKMGYYWDESVDEKSVEQISKNIKENAMIISNDEEEICSGNNNYSKVNIYNPSLEIVSQDEIFGLVDKMEKEALNMDDKIKFISNCVFSKWSEKISIYNSKGLDVSSKRNLALAYIVAVAKEGNDTRTGMGYKVSNNFEEFDYAEIAKEAVENAISMIGAIPVDTGVYSAIFKNTVFAELLEAFSPAFSADNIQKGLSVMKSKLGESIAAKNVNIQDNPLLEGGFASRAFDDEGIACYMKKLVSDGVMEKALHNSKTAKKENISSTGNAYRASYKSSINISPSNMYLENGNEKEEEMIENIIKGIYIKDISGLHSGVNIVSGDFSLPASGFYIENGKKVFPVSNIVISGNIIPFLKSITKIADNLKFTFPSGGACFGSPSILVENLSVAGK